MWLQGEGIQTGMAGDKNMGGEEAMGRDARVNLWLIMNDLLRGFGFPQKQTLKHRFVCI